MFWVPWALPRLKGRCVVKVLGKTQYHFFFFQLGDACTISGIAFWPHHGGLLQRQHPPHEGADEAGKSWPDSPSGYVPFPPIPTTTLSSLLRLAPTAAFPLSPPGGSTEQAKGAE